MSMRVYMDGRELECASGTLEAALAAGRRAAGDRLIIEVRADGFEVPATDIDDPPTRAPYASRLDFTSSDTDELVRGVLADATDALDAVGSRHARAAEQIRGGQIDQALLTLGEVLRTWAEVRSAMELASQLKSPASGPAAENRAQLTPVLAGLAERLAEVKRSLVASDWSSLADVLAYDMEGEVARCRGWLASGRGR